MKYEFLGDLCQITTGKLDVNANSPDGEYPFFTCAELPYRINEYAFNTEAVIIAGNGDLNVKYYKGKFNAYQRTYVIQVLNKKEVNTKYLFYFMSVYIDKLRRKSIGGIIKYIKLGYLTQAKIPLPSFEDQGRIVEILSRIEALINKRRNSIEILDKFRVSTFFKMFGDPVRNENEWDRVPLSDVLLKIESGNSPVCLDREALLDEWGVLKLSAVTQCVYNENENKALPVTQKPNPHIEVHVGDLLFSRKNTYDLVGACAYVWDTRSKLMMSDLIFRLVPRDLKVINLVFLQTLLTFPSERKTIKKLAGGAAGSMPNISKSKLINEKIIVPPISLQNEFSTVAQKVEIIKFKYLENFTELKALFDSLCQNAFKGKLDLTNTPVTIDKDSINKGLLDNEDFDEQIPSRAYSEQELINIMMEFGKEPFSFSELSNVLEESSFIKKPTYEEIKNKIFKMLDDEKPILSQIFDINRKEIVLRINQ